MGLVVSDAKATFKDPEEWRIGFDRNSNFVYPMHSFEIEYFVKFDKDSKEGLGGNPNTRQTWRLGIVQNVLFQWFRFVYQGQNHTPQVFEREFLLPEVDVVPGSRNFPFYGDQIVRPGKPTTRPGTEITYSSDGYRETGSPGSKFDNSPGRFNMWDEPGGSAPLMKGELTLRRLERVIAFQSWLVAIKTGEFQPIAPLLDKARSLVIPEVVREFGTSTVPLASISPFSMTFFADMDLANFKHSFAGDTPTFTWGLYGSPGFSPTRTINNSIKKAGPFPTAKWDVGRGARFPVISGFAGGVSADEAWLVSLGLKL